ncbi:penicillin-binding protein 2 [Campylobacter sp. JMF_15 NE4]|uniref:peptidoglycan D,D-transpeptidase FtsI family protein n=1 Tax=Campylobacter sp. JMF_15 NE4 TaxID=2983825 RepID=UPI0022E9D432|nr:penicillin-binding protein 2 [Campylobacter sp. JMF_15 NE4]MDA3049218.1 penicillin-binding protein 2 [Campylobacter sp. JMF_15 NE4]
MILRDKNSNIGICVLAAVLGFLMCVFVWMMFYSASSDRRLPRLDINETNSAIRGSIITKDKYVVSNSTKLYKVSIDSRSLDPHKLDLFVKLYCIYTGDSEKWVKKTIQSSKGTTVLSYKIDAKTAVHLKELAYKLNLKKFFVAFETASGRVNPPVRMSVSESGEKRTYNIQNSLTPLLGYINKKEVSGITKVVGIKGVEKYYEYYLTPLKDEFITGPRDLKGNIILEKSTKKTNKIDGYNVHLSVPLALQRDVERLIDKASLAYDAKEIVVGIMNSKTGKILSLATNARYNPENITKQDVKNLNSTASEYAYEVGSIMKPIIFSIAYEGNLVKPTEIINTHNGAYKLGSRTIRDTHPAKSMSGEEIIVHSSNIGMIKIAERMSGQMIYDGLLNFGMAQKTGIDLPYEQIGNIPSVRNLEGKVYKATISYGYGAQMTFLQMLSAYGVFNNGGVWISPRLVENLEMNGKIYPVNESETRTVLSPQTADVMREILIKVVEGGTGRKGRTSGIEVGGKTGTARIAKGGGYSSAYNSSFFGFANDAHTSYTIGVLVREPKKGSYYAAQNALPVFKSIVDLLVEKGFLTPSGDSNKINHVDIKDLNEIKD